MSAVRPEPMPVAGTSAAHPVQALGGLDIILHVGRQTASAQGHLTDPRASCLPTPRQRVWCSPHHGAKTAVPNFVMYLSTENINA